MAPTHALISSANVKSADSFCNNTNLLRHLHFNDQIDLVGALSRAARSAMCRPPSRSTRMETESLNRSEYQRSGRKRRRLFRSSTALRRSRFPGDPVGHWSVNCSSPPTPLTAQSPILQVSIGNDFAGACPGTARKAQLSCPCKVPRFRPWVLWRGQARIATGSGTVNQSIGDGEIAEYMVAGAHYSQSSTCCGTYGNMESSANSSTYAHGEVEGRNVPRWPFSNGNAAVFGYCDGDSSQAPNVKDPVCNALDTKLARASGRGGGSLSLRPAASLRRRSLSRCFSKYCRLTALNIFGCQRRVCLAECTHSTL